MLGLCNGGTLEVYLVVVIGALHVNIGLVLKASATAVRAQRLDLDRRLCQANFTTSQIWQYPKSIQHNSLDRLLVVGVVNPSQYEFSLKVSLR